MLIISLIFRLSCGALIHLILYMLPFYFLCAIVIVNSFWRKCLVGAPFPSLNYLLFRKCLVLKASLALFSSLEFSKLDAVTIARQHPTITAGLGLSAAFLLMRGMMFFLLFLLLFFLLTCSMGMISLLALLHMQASKPILSFCFSVVTYMLFAYHYIMQSGLALIISMPSCWMGSAMFL